MLISLDSYADYGLDPTNKESVRKLAAIESKIRRYTNNPFHVREARVETASREGALCSLSPYFREGDTVEITKSGLNDGLYVVVAGEDGALKLDAELFDVPFNRVTLVRYPLDVIEGALGMYEYDQRMDNKRGIASESLSRHSVTYVQPSGTTSITGYPDDVTAFLKPYRRAWF